MPRKPSVPKSNLATDAAVAVYRCPSKRKNNPPAGLAAQGRIKDAPKIRCEYNPHLPPTLRFGSGERPSKKFSSQTFDYRGKLPA